MPTSYFAVGVLLGMCSAAAFARSQARAPTPTPLSQSPEGATPSAPAAATSAEREAAGVAWRAVVTLIASLDAAAPLSDAAAAELEAMQAMLEEAKADALPVAAE